MPSFYEFFAGGGMARAGLGSRWKCLFANDFDQKKGETYIKNWGDKEIKVGDIKKLSAKDLPHSADLAWASFPCQDLSLAGGGAGLKGERSGTFWPFWQLIKSINAEGRAPGVIVLENVCGALTSHDGKDFASICSAFNDEGYSFGAMVIDAALFVPHSRPRLFVIGIKPEFIIPGELVGDGATEQWHPKALRTAFDKLPSKLKENWLWWRMPPPELNASRFADVIEEHPTGVEWHSEEETKKLLGMMSTVNLAKVEQAKKAGKKWSAPFIEERGLMRTAIKCNAPKCVLTILRDALEHPLAVQAVN
ncbi:DNA cytosine methyltransferase [Methylomonas sp. CM2]|uniref:DNA cytosine methyltransferase n=1 Tax=Methylomonas sp. CM2 TaxID=3417647 RepID=UPI003CF4AD23